LKDEPFDAPQEVPLYVEVLRTYINERWSVELVGKGMRGGKRIAFSTASVPVRRRRIVHKSTDRLVSARQLEVPWG